MCNAKYLAIAAITVAAVYTGGAALGAMGAAEGGAVTAGAAEGMATTAGTAGMATTAGTAGTAGMAGTAGSLTAMQTAGLYASVASAGMSAYGQYKQGQAAQDAANYNAKVADLQKQDAIDRGDLDQQKVGRQEAAMRGAQTANMAANGLDLSSGTPKAILDQTDYYGLEDQRTVANNARRESAGYGQRAALYSNQAGSYDPAMAAGTSLLSSSGVVADRWSRYQGR